MSGLGDILRAEKRHVAYFNRAIAWLAPDDAAARDMLQHFQVADAG